jgi:hypothetical protein
MGRPGLAVCNPSPTPGNAGWAFRPMELRPVNQIREAMINTAERLLIIGHLTMLVAPNGQYALT